MRSIIGTTVRVVVSRRIGGRGSLGTIVGANYAAWEIRLHRAHPTYRLREYQVVLEDCPKRSLRFGSWEIEEAK